MQLITKIYKILRYPFEAGLPLLIAVFLLLEVPVLFCGSYSAEWVFYTCSFLSNFLCCYVLILPLYFARRYKITKFVYLIALGIFVSVWCVIDATCSSMHFFFYDDIAAIIKGTNFSEAVEFAEISFNYKAFAILGTTIILSLASYLLIRGCKAARRLFYVGALLLFVCGLAMVARNPASFQHSDFTKSMSFNKYKTPKLEDLLTNPKVEVVDSVRPENIVLVLGESLCRSHCSLYGYEKPTNPKLQQLADSGEIVVFKEVTAPATFTSLAASLILTTKDKYIKNDTCRYTTVFEALKKGGYKTQWISNCSKYGMWDNDLLLYRLICDTCVFSKDVYAHKGAIKKNCDEVVLPLIRDSKLGAPRFTLVHLMGCHHNFNDRYPLSWRRFKESDYVDKPENQRERWMHYDNAVLYNDYVVSEIIKFYEDQEAVLLYFPDHGLDFFVTDDDYCLHAKNNPTSIAAAEDIPLIVYMSESYRAKFPEMKKKLEDLAGTHYYTKDVINEIFEIAGIKLLSER